MKPVEVLLTRAGDLDNRDVIRRGDGWREVLGVYRDWHEVTGEYVAQNIRPDEWLPATGSWQANLHTLCEKAFEHGDEGAYVLVRLLDVANSNPGEIEDTWHVLYRFELVEVQSLPAWGDGVG